MKKGQIIIIVTLLSLSSLFGFLASIINDFVWYFMIFPILIGYGLGKVYDKLLTQYQMTIFDRDFIMTCLYVSLILFYTSLFISDYEQFQDFFLHLTSQEYLDLGLAQGMSMNQFLVNQAGASGFFGYVLFVFTKIEGITILDGKSFGVGVIGSVLLQSLEFVFYYVGMKSALGVFKKVHCADHEIAYQKFGEDYIFPSRLEYIDELSFGEILGSIEDYPKEKYNSQSDKTYYYHIYYKRCEECVGLQGNKSYQIVIEYYGKNQKKSRLRQQSSSVLVSQEGLDELDKMIQEITQKKSEA